MKTQEDITSKIAKLPVWAQEHIQKLTRQRDEALQEQKKYLQDQKESPFYVDYEGPDHRDKRYIQAHHMTVVWDGVKLTIHANPYGNSGKGIRLQWEALDHKDVALIPSSYQGIRLVSQADMY